MRGLENFIKKSNQHIAQQIDIRHEIEKWRREHHGKNPTIIIDLIQMNRVIGRMDEQAIIKGGRFDQINEIVEYFFAEINRCNVNLVCFGKQTNRGLDDINDFTPCDAAYDCIAVDVTDQMNALKNHLVEQFNSYQADQQSPNPPKFRNMRPNERIWYNLLRIAAKHGQLFTNYGLKDRAILAYSQEKRDEILAVMTRDTRFFIYNCDFEYWSLADVNFSTLQILKFSREKLNAVLKLNQQQMYLFSAISKLTTFEKIKLIGYHKRPLLLGLADYVKKQQYEPARYDVSNLSGDLTQDQRQKIAEIISEMVSKDGFCGNWNEDIYDEPLSTLIAADAELAVILQFCKENIPHAYKLMNETMSMPKDLLFIDVRQGETARNYIDLVIRVTLKMVGVAFKDVNQELRPKTRSVINIVPSAPAEATEMDIIYPTTPISLKDLLVKEDDNSFDDARWDLLQWLLDIDADTISKIRMLTGSTFIRVVILSLQFLISNGVISPVESKSILRMEKEGEAERNAAASSSVRPMPQLLTADFPEGVELFWIQICHKYTIAFELVCHCLEMCGLRSETTLLQFDAPKFHQDILKKEDTLPQLLDGIQLN